MIKDNENANHYSAKVMADEDLSIRGLSKRRNNTLFDCTTGSNNLEDII